MKLAKWNLTRMFWKLEDGQTMAEYGVVLAVITVACLAVFGFLSGGITNAVQKVVDVLPG
jgi:Flp pilus assembly pilin Flp